MTQAQAHLSVHYATSMVGTSKMATQPAEETFVVKTFLARLVPMVTLGIRKAVGYCLTSPKSAL